jgi:hypothetical protein
MAIRGYTLKHAFTCIKAQQDNVSSPFDLFLDDLALSLTLTFEILYLNLPIKSVDFKRSLYAWHVRVQKAPPSPNS